MDRMDRQPKFKAGEQAKNTIASFHLSHAKLMIMKIVKGLRFSPTSKLAGHVSVALPTAITLSSTFHDYS